MRYNVNSATAITAVDYFSEGSTCGSVQLSSIVAGNYRAVTGPQTCANPWRDDPNSSNFGVTTFTCATNRDLIYIGSTTIPVTGVITFRTGFNTYNSSTDIAHKQFGYSQDLQFVVLAGAKMLVVALSSLVVVGGM